MKSLGAYISRRLAFFAGFIVAVLLANILAFGFTFNRIWHEEYGQNAPYAMLEAAASALTYEGMSQDMLKNLAAQGIWAMLLSACGQRVWAFDVPEEAPANYTAADVARFSRGYLLDYPVFVWGLDDGALLVLGYPKDSYTKLISNYYSLSALKRLPVFIACALTLDLALLFGAYCLSKRRILQNTGPIVKAIEDLSSGKAAPLDIRGDLADIAGSVTNAARFLRRQNQARADWISGVSHDIRTPLSMIVGHAERIALDAHAGPETRRQAGVIKRQALKIKELVLDLNLASKLEYDMQPLALRPVRLSKLLRAYAAELLNAGLDEDYSMEIDIAPRAENVCLMCDERLIARAINNLVQNSIIHNPQGCHIRLFLERTPTRAELGVADDGVGFSPEKLRTFAQGADCAESAGEKLDMRHGLGIDLVRRIAQAHQGSLAIQSAPGQGMRAVLSFPLSGPVTNNIADSR